MKKSWGVENNLGVNCTTSRENAIKQDKRVRIRENITVQTEIFSCLFQSKIVKY